MKTPQYILSLICAVCDHDRMTLIMRKECKCARWNFINNMDLFNNINSGAKFSECGKHRLSLWRIWDEEKPLIMFIGLNPSTANATTDDPTIRRVKGMAKAWGYGGVYMMNLFTFISTDPKKLNIKGGNLDPLSNLYLIDAGNKCSKVIFAWGNFEVMGRDNIIKSMYPYAYALHINKNGSPKHPLYVKSTITPIMYQDKQ